MAIKQKMFVAIFVPFTVQEQINRLKQADLLSGQKVLMHCS